MESVFNPWVNPSIPVSAPICCRDPGCRVLVQRWCATSARSPGFFHCQGGAGVPVESFGFCSKLLLAPIHDFASGSKDSVSLDSYPHGPVVG